MDFRHVAVALAVARVAGAGGLDVLHPRHLLQLRLAQVVDDAGAQRVAHHVHQGAEAVEQPVYGDDEGHVLGGQADGVQHHDHGDEPCLGDARRAYAGEGGRDADRHDVAEAERDAAGLRDEERGHGLVQRRAVHVDGGADGHDEARDAHVHAVELLEAVHGHGQRGGAGRCPERGGQRLPHVGQEPERQLPRHDGEHDGQQDEAVDEETQQHRHEVHAQLADDDAEVRHLEQLGGDQEQDSDRRHPDDPVGDVHHGRAEALEELEQRLSPLAHLADGDAQDDGEGDEPQDVGAVRELALHLPVQQVLERFVGDAGARLGRDQHCAVL